MALKGLDTKKPIPYVPEVERTNEENPTVFWILPRNSRQNYQALNKYASASTTNREGQTKINANRMYEADKEEFLERVKRVENYEFSNRFETHSKKGIMLVDTPELLVDLIDDLDPAIFQEVIDASSKWAMLKEGEKKDSKF